MASKFKINLDISKDNYLLIKCKQNDDLIMEASLFEFGQKLDISNKTINIKALKADKSYIIQSTNITKNNNKMTAELERDFTRVPGKTKIEIVLEGSGKQNTTFSFYLEVIGSVIDGAVESSNAVTIIETLDNKIVEAVQVKEETEQLIQSGGAATKGDIQQVNSQLEQKANKAFVTPEEFGAKGDAVLVDTTIRIKDIDYPIKKYVGTDDSEAIQKAINYCITNKIELKLLAKNYLLQSDININGEIVITGNGYSSKLIKGIVVINHNTKNILIKDISIVGLYDIFTPLLKITTSTDKFNNAEYWNYMDFSNMGYSGDAITIFGTSSNPTTNITIENCYFAMRCNGVRSSKLDGEIATDYCIKNVLVKGCITDHIWWHGVGVRNTEGIIVDGCIFKNHYVGMMCDFSSGTKDSIMTNCKGYSVANFFKNESSDIYINKNCIISNNTWYSPKAEDTNYKFYCGHTTGENVIVEGNQIFINDVINGFRIAGQNSVFRNNHIVIENFVGETYLFEIYEYLNITGDLLLENNNIYNKTTHRIKVVKSDSVDTNRIIINNNEFIGNFSNLILGRKVYYLKISGNRSSGIKGDMVNIKYSKNILIERNNIDLNNVSLLTIIRTAYENEKTESISIKNNTIRNIFNVAYIPNLLDVDNISVETNEFYNLRRVLMYFGDFTGGNALNESNCSILKVKNNAISITDERDLATIVYINNRASNITLLENYFVNKKSNISTPYQLLYDLRGTANYIKKDYGLNVLVAN